MSPRGAAVCTHGEVCRQTAPLPAILVLAVTYCSSLEAVTRRDEALCAFRRGMILVFCGEGQN